MITALLMLAASAGAAVADPLEDARRAFTRGDYATEYRLLRPLADRGNAEAQSMVGAQYAYGWGVPQNRVEALEWFRRAAEGGIAMEQRMLGEWYHFGNDEFGVLQDNAEAAKWLLRAANQGDSAAQYV
jgi:TPR repeat protein